MKAPPYVSGAHSDAVEVDCADGEVRGTLAEMGFAPHPDRPDALVRSVRDDEEKAEVFASLRDAEIYFAYGREWNPVEVFQHLCEKGLLKGPFPTIRWFYDKIVLQELP